MISAIFARSGGPPAVASITGGRLAKILRTKRGRRDEAERLSRPGCRCCRIGEQRRAECRALSSPTSMGVPSTVQVNTPAIP
jgi:hypothetical protein